MFLEIERRNRMALVGRLLQYANTDEPHARKAENLAVQLMLSSSWAKLCNTLRTDDEDRAIFTAITQGQQGRLLPSESISPEGDTVRFTGELDDSGWLVARNDVRNELVGVRIDQVDWRSLLPPPRIRMALVKSRDGVIDVRANAPVDFRVADLDVIMMTGADLEDLAQIPVCVDPEPVDTAFQVVNGHLNPDDEDDYEDEHDCACP